MAKTVNSGYLLPDSKALDGLMENLEYNRKMGLLNVKAKQDYNAKVNKDFMDNQIKVKSGILFQDELNNATQEWINKGAELRAQGINPFNPNINNPEELKTATDFMRRKSLIEGMADTRDLYQKNFLDGQEQYAKGDIDEDSWAAFNDFYQKSNLSSLYAGGVTPPTLMNAFKDQEFLKNIEAPSYKNNVIKDNIETTYTRPMLGAIRMNVESALSQSPQAQRWFDKTYGINAKSAPAKDILGTTDPLEIDQYLHQYYTTTKEGAAEVLKAFPSGVIPSTKSEEYNEFKNRAIDKQLSAEQRYEDGIRKLTQQKAGDVNQETIKKYNFDLENQGFKREDQDMARKKFEKDMLEFNWKAQDRKLSDVNANKRDQNIQGIQVGNVDEVQMLRQLARAKGGSIVYTNDGKLKVSWKEKNGQSYTTRNQTIDLSPENGDGYVQLNEVLSTLTGKPVDIEKLQVKPEYKGGLVDLGTASATKDQMEFLREKFGKDHKALGDFLYKQGGFKTRGEAFLRAHEVLDKKGRLAVPK